MLRRLVNYIVTFYRLRSGNRPRFLEAINYLMNNINLLNRQQVADSYHAVTEGLEVYK